MDWNTGYPLLDDGAYRIMKYFADTPQVDLSRFRSISDLARDKELTLEELLDSVRQETVQEIRNRYARRVVILPDTVVVSLGSLAERPVEPGPVQRVRTAFVATEGESVAGIFHQEIDKAPKYRKGKGKDDLWWMSWVRPMAHALPPGARAVVVNDCALDYFGTLDGATHVGADCVTCLPKSGHLAVDAKRIFDALEGECERGETSVPSCYRASTLRPAHDVDVEYQWGVQEVPRPDFLIETLPESMTVTAIQVRETGKATRGLHWHLLSNEIAQDEEAAERMIHDYASHWQVERLNYLLKTGYNRDTLRLGDRYDILPLLYSVAALQIMRMCIVGRQEPDLPADLFFTEDAAQALYLYANRSIADKEETYTIQEAIRNLTTLGGAGLTPTDSQANPRRIWDGFGKLLEIMAQMPRNNA